MHVHRRTPFRLMMEDVRLSVSSGEKWQTWSTKERAKQNTGHELEVKNNVEGFRYYNNNNSLHLYSAFLSTLLCQGDISSSTTSVQHPPGWCGGSHSAPERPPHTSLLVERRPSDETNQQIWGLLGGHDGQRPMEKFGQDAGVTPLSFFERHPGIFNDHRESGSSV